MRVGGKREELEAEVVSIEETITEKEAALQELLPEWEHQRALEAIEKRSLDEANATLSALFAKQGRTSKFRTRAERDQYLRHEIASMEAYQKTQTSALETTRTELQDALRAQGDVDGQILDVQEKIEEGRKRVRDLADEITTLKDQQSELIERRKELWREDTKLDSLVRHAADELRSAERNLAGMMDKVCSLSLTLANVHYFFRIRAWDLGPLTKLRKG